jgi:hypothetical protein
MSDPNTIPLPCGGRVALTAGGTGAVRTDAIGMTVWTVRAPDAADPFVALDLEGDAVVATTWHGLSCRVALSDGAVVSTTFVK